MRLTFNIDYHTSWGESVYLTGSLPEFEAGLRMDAGDGGRQSVTVEVSPAQGVFSYRYELRDESGVTVRREWGRSRRMCLDARLTEAEVYDLWQDVPSDKPFYSSAFTESIFRHEAPHLHSTKAETIEFRIEAPEVPTDAVIAMSGNCQALGMWEPGKAPVMNASAFPTWTLQLRRDELPQEFDYKFVMLDSLDRSVRAWEQSDNRHFNSAGLKPEAAMIVSGMFFHSPLPKWRGSGTAIPVFSLRSEKGLGVGEFLDLEMLIDWAQSTGQQFIQLLPVNDTTMTRRWTDSYPYTNNSTFALHPMYLRVDEVGMLTDEERKEFEAEKHRLNSLSALDYEAVNNVKERFLRSIYRRQGAAEMTSGEFNRFAGENNHWLMPYAAWSVLRDKYSTPDMTRWGEYAVYDEERISRFIEENRDAIDYYRFVQYHLHRQLSRVRDYANRKGVVLKGDIPIGISRCSVDAWLYPELFNFSCTTGAPPDDFAVLGQNWGFPTYRWDVMRNDDYKWWRARLGKMAEYFSAYRIDHLLGFFRIWQIPADTLHGLLGVFCPALPLTPEEMVGYGFDFHDEFTRPYIDEKLLDSTFGELKSVAKTCLRERDGLYSMAGGFSTQLAIARYFATMPDDDSNRRVCAGLMNLLDEVLFIEDPYEAGKYHPRIDGRKTARYAALPEAQQLAFNALYEDFYYHRHDDFWRAKAMEKLPALIDSTGMLCCAEDLGMIPRCVPEVMKQLQMLSLEIQRMPKEAWVPFGNPARYPYLSVCSTSSHDMSGIRAWWEEDYERSQLFWHDMLHHDGQAPREATPEVCREIIMQNLAAPSMLCILPLQDWLGMSGKLRRSDAREEQINVPADSHHYWRYRMHITLETLLADMDFAREVSSLTARN